MKTKQSNSGSEVDTIELVRNIDAPRSKNLVFTSAGNHTNIDHWVRGRQDFDLMIVNYADPDDQLRQIGDYYANRPGSKFQNLNYAYQHWRPVLDQYEAIFVLDDDLIFDGESISRLFEILDEYDLWMLQPGFHISSRLSTMFNCARPFVFMRFTNWIETGAMLFRKDILDQYMTTVYDPRLVSWGTDRLVLHMLRNRIERKVAIVDTYACVNPHESTKSGKREIDNLQSRDERKQVWDEIRQSWGIPRRCGKVVYKTIWKRRFALADVRYAIEFGATYLVRKAVLKPLRSIIRRLGAAS
jgi:hypothetical protein